MGKTISFVKGKGSLSHNNREFIAKNVDAQRIPWNVTYVKQPLREAYEQIFGPAVEAYNAKQKRSDRRIDDYLSKIKNSGNNEKQFYEIVVQIGKRDDTGVLDENGKLTDAAVQAKELLDSYARSFQERNPNLILFNAVLHMDEATPHLHLDYIPVAHGYKRGLGTRNSLTKALQEMEIEPAVSKTETETMHWQQRERQFLTDLCQERGIEIEVLGVDRDDYSIPEYKAAMREKEAAEAEIEILHSEKAEIESVLEAIDTQIESGQEEIQVQIDTLESVKAQIAETEARIQTKEKTMDMILAAGKPVEKEIKEIRAKAADIPAFFGGEPMVKIPRKTFEKMISRYRAAGTFENLNLEYQRQITARQSVIDKLQTQIKSLKNQIMNYQKFLGERGLIEAFAEYIRPKSMHERLEIGKRKAKEESLQRNTVRSIQKHKRDIAI